MTTSALGPVRVTPGRSGGPWSDPGTSHTSTWTPNLHTDSVPVLSCRCPLSPRLRHSPGGGGGERDDGTFVGLSLPANPESEKDGEDCGTLRPRVGESLRNSSGPVLGCETPQRKWDTGRGWSEWSIWVSGVSPSSVTDLPARGRWDGPTACLFCTEPKVGALGCVGDVRGPMLLLFLLLRLMVAVTA